jgi:hypothetical protein
MALDHPKNVERLAVFDVLPILRRGAERMRALLRVTDLGAYCRRKSLFSEMYHDICEEYRAAAPASIDVEHDRADKVEVAP